MMLLWILAVLMGTAMCYPMSKVNPGAQVAADQVATYNNPGVQAGAGQGSSNQNSGQFAAGSQGQEGAATLPVRGYAYHIDAHSHNSDGLAGAAASYGVEVAEPIFSDVSYLNPVYNFRSISKYNNGRVLFFRTTYNPAEPAVPPVMPVYRSVFAQNIPASQDVQANDQVKARQ